MLALPRGLSPPPTGILDPSLILSPIAHVRCAICTECAIDQPYGYPDTCG